MTSKTVGGVTTNYTYDLAGQLASESRPGYSCSYTYDANGNRLTKTLNGVDMLPKNWSTSNMTLLPN